MSIPVRLIHILYGCLESEIQKHQADSTFKQFFPGSVDNGDFSQLFRVVNLDEPGSFKERRTIGAECIGLQSPPRPCNFASAGRSAVAQNLAVLAVRP